MRTGIDVVGVKIEGVGVAGVVEMVGPANPQSPASNLGTKGLAIAKTRTMQKMREEQTCKQKQSKKPLTCLPSPACYS